MFSVEVQKQVILELYLHLQMVQYLVICHIQLNIYKEYVQQQVKECLQLV